MNARTTLFHPANLLFLSALVATRLLTPSLDAEAVVRDERTPAPERIVHAEVQVVRNANADHELRQLRTRSPFASLAARRLAAEGDRRALPVMISLLESARTGRRIDDLSLRLACIDGLARFGGDQAVRALERVLEAPTYEGLVAPAARALGRIGDTRSARVMTRVASALQEDGDRVMEVGDLHRAIDAAHRRSFSTNPLS